MRKTKIIATIGPACDSANVLLRLAEAGMNAARLNFSHGTPGEHLVRIAKIRQIEQDSGHPIAIILDTAGPEIRTGALGQEEVELVDSQHFTLTGRPITGDNHSVSVSYPGLAGDLQPGAIIILDDGLIELQVLSIHQQDILCQVLAGGILRPGRGLNVPGYKLGLPFMSDKDRSDILLGIENQVDFIAASFVRSADDILEIRRILEAEQASIQLIAKIESRNGVKNIDDIIKVADGIMVARGDLGVEIPAEEVPVVQQMLVRKCREAGKIVIIATQMLESMISHPRPTRAEVSDVAYAVLAGADAIMLSGETAAGRYPVEAVETMDRIALRSEKEYEYTQSLQENALEKNLSITDAVAYATCSTASHLNIDTIITATRTGQTACRVARYRPESTILAVTPDPRVLKRLCLVWGVQPLLITEAGNTDELLERAVQACLHSRLIQNGDLTIFAAGNPTGFSGDTNFIKVHLISDIIMQGTGIGKTAVWGPARIIHDEYELEYLEEGDILVTRSANRDYIPYLNRAKGIIAEEGGLTSDTAIIGLNLGIPVIVGADDATRLISDGEIISIDSYHGRVYKGRIRHSG